jgi:hypothetical protein
MSHWHDTMVDKARIALRRLTAPLSSIVAQSWPLLHHKSHDFNHR